MIVFYKIHKKVLLKSKNWTFHYLKVWQLKSNKFVGTDTLTHKSLAAYSEIRNRCCASVGESRREWMLWMMERAAKKYNNSSKFQLWQPESHPIQLDNNKMAHQKLEYIHYNPVEAGFVEKPEDWKYSSAIDYMGGKGLLEIIFLDNLIL